MRTKLILTCIFVSMLFFPAQAQHIDTIRLNQYLDYLTQEKAAIGNLSIFQNGKEVYNQNFGQENVPELKFDENTGYHIASITKLFTATLIWQLIEDGKLSPDDKLATFFPQMPGADKITIKDLLQHSSGLGSYLHKENDFNWLYRPVKKEAILEEIQNQDLLFEPGTEVAYSNSGYFLLGNILEQKYRETYGQILEKKILIPFGIKNTFSAEQEPINVFPALTYNYVKGIWEGVEEDYYKNDLGVGSMVSTPKALNEFIIKLFSGEILSPKTLEQMKPIINKEIWGRGLMLIPFFDETEKVSHIGFGHGGDINENHAVVEYVPKEKMALSFSVNGIRFSRNDFMIDILNILYNNPLTYPQFFNQNLTPATLNKYTGTYENKQLAQKATFVIKKDILAMDGSSFGTDYLKLIPLNTKEFKIKDLEDLTLSFEANGNSVTINQNGEDYIFERIYRED